MSKKAPTKDHIYITQAEIDDIRRNAFDDGINSEKTTQKLNIESQRLHHLINIIENMALPDSTILCAVGSIKTVVHCSSISIADLKFLVSKLRD